MYDCEWEWINTILLRITGEKITVSERELQKQIIRNNGER